MLYVAAVAIGFANGGLGAAVVAFIIAFVVINVIGLLVFTPIVIYISDRRTKRD